ncbi:hypothetical protein P3T37_004331 [Kitasatospora sp. MAA4]|uniref:hypothetical protein n=1 Tax=Kitasatospora sp. MAA4 TaxID=3035093 RepID=UPI00247BB97C|nr:hypothetical protein [Kitasatospora sp. MAA4]
MRSGDRSRLTDVRVMQDSHRKADHGQEPMNQNGSHAERLPHGNVESAVGGLRLLPWTASDGRLCSLSTDGRGYLLTLADDLETMQLSMGEELLEYARGVLDPGERVPSSVEYRWLACRLAEALSDALRVADSRGQRIPAPQEEDEDARADEH